MKRYFESGAYNAAKVDEQTKKLKTAIFDTGLGKAAQKTFGLDLSNKYDIDATEKSQILSATGGTNQALEAIKKTMADKNITAQSRNFQESVTTLLDNNTPFREFMIKGAQITDDDYNKNKANILSPNNEVGQKMLQFLSYAVSNDLKEGSRMPTGNEIPEFISKNMQNSKVIPTAPLYYGKKAEKKDKAEAE